MYIVLREWDFKIIGLLSRSASLWETLEITTTFRFSQQWKNLVSSLNSAPGIPLVDYKSSSMPSRTLLEKNAKAWYSPKKSAIWSSKREEFKIPAFLTQLLCFPGLPSFSLYPGLIPRGTNTSQQSGWSCEHQGEQNPPKTTALFRSGVCVKHFWDSSCTIPQWSVHSALVFSHIFPGDWASFMCCCVWAKQGNEKDKNLRQLAFHGKTERTAHSGMKNWQVPKRRLLLPT